MTLDQPRASMPAVLGRYVTEQVVLLDEDGRPAGHASGAMLHHQHTPLHLAYSCFLFRREGRLLLTMRSSRERIWPGYWTSSCYGHPAPGEPVPAAMTRTLCAELGLTSPEPELMLPAFRYHAVMDNGITENAVSPVFRVVTEERPAPDPRAVADFEWVDWTDLVSAVRSADIALSPWCRLQVLELSKLGDDPTRWPTADVRLLPGGAERCG